MNRLSASAILLCVALQFVSSTKASPAKIASVSTYSGECHHFDTDPTAGIVSSPCDSVVNGLTFVDGYTSLQFILLDGNGKASAKMMFVGPRWTQVDETHSSMVLEQVIVAKEPSSQSASSSPSGFCLFSTASKDKKYDEPRTIYCEYNANGASRIYILDSIAKIDAHYTK